MKNTDLLKAFPNRYPYNDLLFLGKLEAKTRTWKWSHTGLVLLYTSSHKEKNVVKAHGLPDQFEKSVIVGAGILAPVRVVTERERSRIEKQFGNGKFVDIYAGSFRYKFSNLVKFENPISFLPPKGAVSVFNVPFSVVKAELKKHPELLAQAVPLINL